MDLFINISKYLHVGDVVKLTCASKSLYSLQSELLLHRKHEITHFKRALRWCNICDKSVTVDSLYIMFVCTCESNVYPYYHMCCLGKYSITKGYTLELCPKCKRRKAMIYCDNGS